MKSLSVRFAVLSCVLVCALVDGGVWAGDEVMQVAANAPGFSATMAYQDMGSGESVNPFNGGLTVVHRSSIGLPSNMGSEIRPVRVYNSKNSFDAYGDDFSGKADRSYGPLGWGWHMGFGRVFMRFSRVDIYVPPGAEPGEPPYQYKDFVHYFYEDESGAEHRLFTAGGPQLIGTWQSPPSWQAPAQTWYFTNDSSFIRAKFYNGVWTIYFPDGSVRTAGLASVPANGYIAPQLTTGTGTAGLIIENPSAHGWYVTQIKDRAGNLTDLEYREYTAQTGVGGALLRIVQTTLGSSREILFSYAAVFNGGRWHLLLQTISAGSGANARTESFFYQFVSDASDPNLPQGTVPILQRVVDPAGLTTWYGYGNPPAFTTHPFLSSIGYPTGAISSYSWDHRVFVKARRWGAPYEVNYDLESIATPGVSSHTVENRPEQGQAANRLTWKWYRGTEMAPTTPPTMPHVIFVVTVDPLGTEEVRYFASDDSPDSLYPAGTELRSDRRRPGAPSVKEELADPQQDPRAQTTFNQNIVSTTVKEWESGGGDAQLCYEYFIDNPQPARHGNLRTVETTTSERAPAQIGTTALWTKHSKNSYWNGFGHYEVTKNDGSIAGGAPQEAKIIISLRVPPDELPAVSAPYVYQTDRVYRTLSGRLDSYEETTDTCGTKNLIVREYNWNGDFKAVYQLWDPVTGLPTKILSRKVPESGYMVVYNPCHNTPRPIPTNVPTPVTGDKLLEITYNAQGNISRLKYSGGDSTTPSPAYYAVNFEWSFGMVSKMSRDNSPYGDEFNREISGDFSQIMSQTDPNGLTTTYTYSDGLGRLTRMTLPDQLSGREHATYIAYPTESASWDIDGPSGPQEPFSWTTAHNIFFYRGPEKAMPWDMATFDEDAWRTGIDAGAAYQHYIFDDLGRLVKTRSLHPGEYLTETLTAYDPLGNIFFTSLPYRLDAEPTFDAVDWATKLETDDVFVSPIVLNAQELESPYGSVTSIFNLATWPHAGDSGLQKLIAVEDDSRDIFDRPIWVFKPDGSRTKTTYLGLDTATTLFGIKTGEGTTTDSTTWYRKDIWGRLTRVEPPLGTTAVYSYNGFDQLIQVNLTNQVRTFTHDVFGRLRSATNPENGVTNFLKYDCLGNLLEAQDALGAAASMPYKLVNEYDAVGRQTASKQVKVSDGSTLLVLAENLYDRIDGNQRGASLGKLVQSISRQKDQTGVAQTVTTSLMYNSANQDSGRLLYLQQTASVFGAGAPLLSETLDYDQYGQITKQAVAEGAMGRGTLLNTYLHGAVGSRAVENDRVLLANLNYNTAGALVEVLFDTGAIQQVSFDRFVRPSGFRMTDGVNTFWGNGSYAAGSYTYDGAGNIASVTESGGGVDSFAYDALSRLTKADVYKGTDKHTYLYAYDAWGNLTQRTEDYDTSKFTSVRHYLTSTTNGGLGLPDGEAQAYIKEVMFSATVLTTGGAKNNRLGTVTRGGTVGGRVSGIPQTPATMTYDANGNTLSDGQYVYRYDGLNRQVAVYLSNGTTKVSEHFYDPAGERVATLGYSGGVLSTFTQYLREGAAVVYEKKWTRSGSNWVAASDKLYAYAGDRMAATKETVGAATTYTYYAVDHLGTVRYSRTLNPNGTLVSNGTATFKAEPFGVMILSVAGSVNGNTRFYTGHERDPLPSGFNQDYMHFRYYGSSMGRFFKPDNLSDGAAANPQGWNLYSYVKGNPVNHNDPTGHQTGPGANVAQLQSLLFRLEAAVAQAESNPNLYSADEVAAIQYMIGVVKEMLGQVQTEQKKKTPEPTTNPVVQVPKDLVVGVAKEAANTIIDATNMINAPIDCVLSTFTTFQFGHQWEGFQSSTQGEKNVMAGLFILSFLGGGGEAKAATKVETLVGEAERLYPKLVGKFQDHHIWPQYLGGAKDGATARIPSAYHQLITNEFRKLAPYGQKVQRSAEEVEKIMREVYSKFPLP